jgi:hypothetical protein
MPNKLKQIVAATLCLGALFCGGCKTAGGGTSFWPFSSASKEDPEFRRTLTDTEANAVRQDTSFPTYQEVQMQAMQSGGTVIR